MGSNEILLTLKHTLPNNHSLPQLTSLRHKPHTHSLVDRVKDNHLSVKICYEVLKKKLKLKEKIIVGA
jgi:hypothetical protein